MVWTIVIDIDNTLNNWLENSLSVYNKLNGTDLKIEDVDCYDLEKSLGQEFKNWTKEHYSKLDSYAALKMQPDAEWVIRSLASCGDKIVFATSDTATGYAAKQIWLMKHFDGIDYDFVLADNKSLIRGDIIIEDCLEQAVEFLGDRIVFDYPYNRNDRKDWVFDINRVSKWSDILNTINLIKGRYEHD